MAFGWNETILAKYQSLKKEFDGKFHYLLRYPFQVCKVGHTIDMGSSDNLDWVTPPSSEADKSSTNFSSLFCFLPPNSIVNSYERIVSTFAQQLEDGDPISFMSGNILVVTELVSLVICMYVCNLHGDSAEGNFFDNFSTHCYFQRHKHLCLYNLLTYIGFLEKYLISSYN